MYSATKKKYTINISSETTLKLIPSGDFREKLGVKA